MRINLSRASWWMTRKGTDVYTETLGFVKKTDVPCRTKHAG